MKSVDKNNPWVMITSNLNFNLAIRKKRRETLLSGISHFFAIEEFQNVQTL
jgi:hypothetical protein